MNQVVHAQARVGAPPERVFAMLADPTGWPAWSGHDRGEVVSVGTPEPQGVGAVRRFTLGRYRSVEEIVAFDRPTHFAYVLRSGLPVRGYRADVRLTPGGEGGTAITWHSEFQARVPGTGGAIRRRLQKFIEHMLVGLDAHASQPERV
jgi:uncharacterized protein YndB with AHSA1/START domain